MTNQVSLTPSNIVEKNFVGLANYLTNLKVEFKESTLKSIFGAELYVTQKHYEYINEDSKAVSIRTKFDDSLLKIKLFVADNGDDLSFKVDMGRLPFRVYLDEDGKNYVEMTCESHTSYINRLRPLQNDLKTIDILYRNVIQSALLESMYKSLFDFNNNLYKLECKKDVQLKSDTTAINFSF